MHIVIDGYNVIRQSPPLKAKEKVSMEAGRVALLKLLARFRQIKGHRITCVFDGKEGPGGREKREVQMGIEVIYSVIGETADDVIKRIAQGQSGKLLVVTSDREIGNFVLRRGGAALSSPEFESLMESSLNDGLTIVPEEQDGEEDNEDRPPRGTAKKGPSRRLSRADKRLRQALSKL